MCEEERYTARRLCQSRLTEIDDLKENINSSGNMADLARG